MSSGTNRIRVEMSREQLSAFSFVYVLKSLYLRYYMVGVGAGVAHYEVCSILVP